MDGSAPVCSSPPSQPIETRYVAEQFVACDDEDYVVFFVTLWPGSIDISFSADYFCLPVEATRGRYKRGFRQWAPGCYAMQYQNPIFYKTIQYKRQHS